MTRLIGIFGSAGFAREVMPLVRSQTKLAEDRVVFVDRDPGSPIDGHDVIGEDAFLRYDGRRQFVVAIADAAVRKRVTGLALESGAEPFEVRASTSLVHDSVRIGAGAVLCDHTIITSNVKIGLGLHLNIYSYIAHDCVVGENVTFAPRVSCNGNVVIEDGAYLGTGAVLRQGLPDAPLVIGAGAVVGMGAVVTKSVAPGTTVVGNPAKLFLRT